MICTTIQNKTLAEIYDILDGGKVEMAEIRLDRCTLDNSEIEELFSTADIPLVATCRVSELCAQLAGTADSAKIEGRAAQIAEARLITAIHAGALYADVEIEAPAMMSKRLRRETRECGTILIRSYHDFDGTDSPQALKALAEKCYNLGADIAKIVTTAHSDADCEKTIGLYKSFEPGKLIAFCMGECGKGTRVDCLKHGAPYSYCALSADEAAAPGQIALDEMKRLVYGDFHFIHPEDVTPVPASKSFAQRAIIAAAMADGVSHLSGYSPCGDNESAVSVARALGAEVTVGTAYQDGRISKNESVLTIKGINAAPHCCGLTSLHTGESGFLTRLMIPLLSLLSKDGVEVTGERTLVKRPLIGARDIMSGFGVDLASAGQNPGEEIYVPLSISGSLTPGEVEISGKAGSQLISGLLAALPLAATDSTLKVKDPKSIPYLFITLDVMKAFGVRAYCDMEGGKEFAETKDWNSCDLITFHIKGGQSYKAADMTIEGDWSAAANFLVAGAIFGNVDINGLDTKSLQADLSIMDILMEAGASLSQDGEDDSRGVIHVRRSPLSAFEIDASNCPDLFPIVAVLAAFCQGTSRIAGIGRLAHKESDRASAILNMLVKMGVSARIGGDVLIIEGMSLSQRILSGKMLRGGGYTSNHDHRMVMALKVAELGADSPIEIDDTGCVGKSFPAFLEIFSRL